ncbi:hypothetical protein D3C81_1773970 [compost metagenome]
MRGDHVGAQVQSQVENPLGFFHLGRILSFVLEAVAPQVAAQGADLQAQRSDICL